MRQRYVGHCNTGTDIKQASFLGEKGSFLSLSCSFSLCFAWVQVNEKMYRPLILSCMKFLVLVQSIGAVDLGRLGFESLSTLAGSSAETYSTRYHE